MVQRGHLWESPLTITVATLWFEMKGYDTLNAEMMYFLRWIAIGTETSDLGIQEWVASRGFLSRL
jgi:hypothetical protein